MKKTGFLALAILLVAAAPGLAGLQTTVTPESLPNTNPDVILSAVESAQPIINGNALTANGNEVTYNPVTAPGSGNYNYGDVIADDFPSVGEVPGAGKVFAHSIEGQSGISWLSQMMLIEFTISDVYRFQVTLLTNDNNGSGAVVLFDASGNVIDGIALAALQTGAPFDPAGGATAEFVESLGDDTVVSDADQNASFTKVTSLSGDNAVTTEMGINNTFRNGVTERDLWDRVFLDITSDTDVAYVGIAGFRTNQYVDVFIDNFSYFVRDDGNNGEIPEPASLVVWGLISVALVGVYRRRRAA